MMKAAARAWKAKGSRKRSSSPARKPQKRKVRRMARKKKTKKRGGFKLPGGVGPKGILTGVLGLAVIPQFIPVATPGAAKLGTGIALRALGLSGGAALSTVGIMELAASYIAPAFGGMLGGGGATTRSGGYDY